MEQLDKVLVVIPAYNEEANIELVVEELIRDYPDLDYVVVNDGSTDKTMQICREHGYCLLDLPVNLGLAGCFQAGMKYAFYRGYVCAVQFDGDGQHRPEYILPMKRKMEEGYDIVIGSRFVDKAKGYSIRMVGSRLLAGAIRITTGAKVAEPDTVSYLLKQGARVAEIPVVIGDRLGGESYLKPVVAVRYMVRMLLSILLIQNFRKR